MDNRYIHFEVNINVANQIVETNIFLCLVIQTSSVEQFEHIIDQTAKSPVNDDFRRRLCNAVIS